ncbi:hypothetical protein C5Y96_00535 [Blastopirellula marina]|uniref:Uncharacterized protein n=1 Tax=Blastopirellula marina TaxID=124 RepID=A0A2S8G9U6_9BACT|nr:MULTISPECIES: hypothetical protein [Pirellulaceae]PQO41236.1 hypothetical protein C5Y96_00535 [Blastopirellula marina]RCS56260.1 hypothetical protein DTL36_00535 [Bremerella cremea]
MKTVWLPILSVLLFVNGLLAETPPATVDEAAKAIDFSKFKLVNPVEDSTTSCIASQSYRAKGDVDQVTNEISKQLTAAGFKQAEGATITPAYASAVFLKDGFSVSLSIFPSGDNQSVQVALRNHGNVNLEKIVASDKLQKTYALPGSVMYTTKLSPEDARKLIRQELESQKWEWFGDTTVSFFMRQNAVRLQVMVNQSPAQPGTTAIQISSEQLSTELPIPSKATMIQYADINGGMIMDSTQSTPELVADLRQRFEKLKWKSTTDNLVKVGIHDHLIFRNNKEELADCEFFEFDGKSRCKISYQTKEQVDRENALAKKAAMDAEAKSKAAAEIKKVTISPIAGAKVKSKNQISIQTKSGGAAAILKAWLDNMKADGWKLESTVDTPQVAELSLEKDGVKLSITLVDPGFIPGEIEIRADKNCEIIPGR